MNVDRILVSSEYLEKSRFSLAARNIQNIEFFSFTDPFLLIYRPDEIYIPSNDYANIPEQNWTMVHKTNVKMDMLNPNFNDWVDYPDNICRSYPECWLKV